MSQENVEVVRRLNAAFTGSDPQPPSEFAAPDAVWDLSTFLGWPEQSEYRGFDGFNDFLEAWTAPYDEFSYDVEQILDGGANLVVAVCKQRGRLPDSDSWTELRYALVYTVDDGLVQRTQVYPSAAEALEAVGLSE
jgi:ketosteroid isomerase-like protein